MSESLFHWVAFLGGIVVQAIIAAFVYGKLTATVTGTSNGLASEKSDRKDDVRRLDREQNEQWTEINANGRAVEKIKGKLGINGA